MFDHFVGLALIKLEILEIILILTKWIHEKFTRGYKGVALGFFVISNEQNKFEQSSFSHENQFAIIFKKCFYSDIFSFWFKFNEKFYQSFDCN